MSKGCEQTSPQRWFTNGQQAYEKMINITNRQRNTNQKQNEVSPHTHQDGYYQNRKQVLVRMWRNLEPLCTVGGIVKWCKHYGKHCKGSSKNRTTIRFSNHAWVHSWPSNNMGLKSTYTWIQWVYLYVDFFSTVNTTVLHNMSLADSRDAEPRKWRNHGYGELTINYTCIFNCTDSVALTPALFNGQLYI